MVLMLNLWSMSLEGLGGLIKGLESQASWQAQKQFRLVLLHWPKAVGFAVARKTRPIAIQRGTLYVATATAVWAQTLAYSRLDILRKLNRHQRQPIRTIRFSTAQWANAIPTPTSENSPGKARLAKHPSYIGDVPQLNSTAAQPSSQTLKTPAEAFTRWATALQQMQKTQALCPDCRCRCPHGELDRWGRCALCAAQQWR